MSRPGSFSVTLPDRIRDKLDNLAVAADKSETWVVEVLLILATKTQITHPDVMLLVADGRRRRRRRKRSAGTPPQEASPPWNNN